jgi:glycosyltransferase involved in cell wall biosynthesis
MPLLSIIIPTYNRKKLIMRAIDSVFQQSLDCWEMVVVDDASQDATETLDVFSGNNSKLSYTRFDLHRGVSAARNMGVSKAAGQWICFLDSDDQWHRNKLKKQIAWIETHASFRICQTQEIWMRNGVRVNPPKTHQKIQGVQFKESLERCMITPSSVMMEKTMFWEAGGFNETLPVCEDYDLWLRITPDHPIGLVDEPLLTRFGGHPDQLSGSVMGLDRFRIRSILDLLAGSKLTEAQRMQALGVLVKKAFIVADGYKKRGNIEEYEQYRRIARYYEGN